MPDYSVPLSVPNISGNEWGYIKQCLDSSWVSSAGNYVDLFEKKVANYIDAKFSIACVNGTSALQISLLIAGVKPGDEVIVPTLTFISPVNAVRYNGAEPIFMDADENYNLDAEKTLDFLKKETVYKDGNTFNNKTNARIAGIIPVHVFGNPVLLDELKILCDEQNIAFIEDATESLGSFYTKGEFTGKHAGTIGDLGCLSFNGNKIITTGGGGMIITENEKLAEKARYLTTQAKDDPIRYIHHEVGYNFRLTNIQAAMGVAQLEKLEEFLNRKEQVHKSYSEAIEKIKGLSLLQGPGYAKNNYWLNILQIDQEKYFFDRDELMLRLEQRGIQARPVWALIHNQKPYKKCQTYEIDRAEDLIEKS
ncbi:MAG: LegC family aminotransferase, partial [Candidatus Neomarinimicrobiota bacterium]